MGHLYSLSSFVRDERDRLWHPKVQPSQAINFPRELDALLIKISTEATMGYLQQRPVPETGSTFVGPGLQPLIK